VGGGGTLAYKSPEAFEGDAKFSTASDVYAFGIVCWELLTGEQPWADYSQAALLGAVMRGERPTIPESASSSPRHGAPALNVQRLIASKAQQCWLQEASSRPTFAQLSQQLEYSYAQLQTELGSRQAAVDAGDGRADVFISFRFGEAHAEALALKTALEQLKLKVFLSSVSPGGDLQDAISAALANCRAAVILATKTYGAKTNGLFDTSNEMNFVVGERKPYYLVRMIPMDETWAESHVTLAFPRTIMFKLWLPGEPMPWDLVHEVCEIVKAEGGAVSAEPP